MLERAKDLPSIDEFVSRLGAGGAAGTAAQGSGGAVAALAAALAVDLAAQVALESPEWAERGGALAQADAIRERSIRLATRVEQLYTAARERLMRAGEAQDATSAPRGEDLGTALTGLVDALLAIAENAGDAAALAELTAQSCASVTRATAVAATILAASAAEAAAHMVEVNLLVRPGDANMERARELVEAAAASRTSARLLPR